MPKLLTSDRISQNVGQRRFKVFRHKFGDGGEFFLDSKGALKKPAVRESHPEENVNS